MDYYFETIVQDMMQINHALPYALSMLYGMDGKEGKNSLV